MDGISEVVADRWAVGAADPVMPVIDAGLYAWVTLELCLPLVGNGRGGQPHPLSLSDRRRLPRTRRAGARARAGHGNTQPVPDIGWDRMRHPQGTAARRGRHPVDGSSRGLIGRMALHRDCEQCDNNGNASDGGWVAHGATVTDIKLERKPWLRIICSRIESRFGGLGLG